MFEPLAIILAAREIPRVELGGIDAMLSQRPGKSLANRGDVALSTHFADETTFRTECPANAVDHPIRLTHPVQRRVREHRVERVRKGKCMSVDHPDIQAAPPCRGSHVGGRVNADDECAGRGDLLAQHPVAATEIENAFAGPRVEQCQNVGAQGRNVAGVFGVGVGRPGM